MLGRPLRERVAPRTWIVRFAGSAATALVLTAAPGRARAADFEIDSDIYSQGYDVYSPWGNVSVGRKRLGATLSLAAYNLQGDYRPLEPDYAVALRMRVDTDFGYRNGETQYDNDPTLYIPGMSYAPVELQHGYVEGRNIGDGWFGFRVGRQYLTDVLGWWSFDGALLRVTTPFYLQAEVYGGLEQRGGLPLSSSRFESQGVWRGGHGDLKGDTAADFPSYQFAEPAPAVGFAVEANGPNWIHGRFDYRRVWSTGPAFTQQFAAPGGGFPQIDGLRLSQERFGYAGSAYLPDIGGIKGGFVYDVGSALVSQAYGGVEFYPVHEVTLGADVDYFVPTFDADSIWNWFSHNGITTVEGRLAARPVEHLELSLTGGTRLWMTNSLTSQGTSFAPDLVSDLGARYGWGTGRVGLRAALETGFGDPSSNRGRRAGVDVSVQQELVPDQFWLGGSTSVFNWDDPLRTERNATSFGYVVAPEYAPADFARMRVEWEHDINRLVGQRFRLLGMLSFRVGVTP